MADTKISALTAYTTPQAGDIIPIVDSTNATTKGITYANFRGSTTNASSSTVSAGFAADTYLAGSNIPSPAPVVGSTYYASWDVVKTAAGIATPIITVRFGTAGTTADASVMTLTFAAGTAAIDTGLFEVWLTFRTVGSGTTAIVQARTRVTHALAATGITSTGAAGSGVIIGTSAGFNSTTSGAILGLSLNGGTSAAWTVTNVQSAFRF